MIRQSPLSFARPSGGRGWQSEGSLAPILLVLTLALLLTGCASSAAAAPSPIPTARPPLPAVAPSATAATQASATTVPSPQAKSASASATVAPVVPPKPGAVTVVPILMYHYIRELPPKTPDQLGYGLSIAPSLFDQQLGYLAKAGYTSVSMEALVSHMSKGSPLPAKPIVLSFDDGYADFYTAALPVLKKHHFTATAYLVVDFLGRPGYMSWQQAQDLRDSGMEIGAHTMDHVDLAIQPLAKAQYQIDGSRRSLQTRLSLPIDTFAYPSGRYNATTVKLAADAGFSSAVTTAFGERHTVAQLLTLSRVRVPGGISMPSFIKNLG